MFIMLYTYM